MNRDWLKEKTQIEILENNILSVLLINGTNDIIAWKNNLNAIRTISRNIDIKYGAKPHLLSISDGFLTIDSHMYKFRGVWYPEEKMERIYNLKAFL